MTDKPFVKSYMLDDEIMVIKLHGQLDQNTSEELREEVFKHAEEGHNKIIIDCAHLGYVSSYGIGALVRLQARLRKQGGEVKLAAIQTVVSDIIRVVRLEKMLDIYGDIQFAKESFAKSKK